MIVHALLAREAVTGLSEAGDESLLEQLLSLCGEQAASVEDIYSVVTPSEVSIDQSEASIEVT